MMPTEQEAATQSPDDVLRSKIVATFETSSWLHIGDGDTEAMIREEKKEEVSFEAHKVALDQHGLPYIPATAFKGAFRRFCESQFTGLGPWFGTLEFAGEVEFSDGFLPPGSAAPTQIIPFVAVDRVTRTAAHKKLAHVHAVAPGSRFCIEMLLRGIGRQETSWYLAALRGFLNGEPRLGAGTADGWGSVLLTDVCVSSLSRSRVADWAKAPGAPLPWQLDDIAEERPASAELRGEELTISVDLRFAGAFLVQDHPLKYVEGEPIRPRMGRGKEGLGPVLPASSFRGAFRSQAERILRTLHLEDGACDAAKPCSPVRDSTHLKRAFKGKNRLCPACRVFGATGWRSPIDIRVEATEAPPLVRQEFVAIDRFTGGVAGSKKFAAERPWKPQYKVALTLNKTRLSKARAGEWAYGLIALTLRDLADGDITLGWGAAKGYGSVEPFGVGPLAAALGGDLTTQVKALSEMFSEKKEEKE